MREGLYDAASIGDKNGNSLIKLALQMQSLIRSITLVTG